MLTQKSAQEQAAIISENAVDVLPHEELLLKLERSIRTSKPLNVKLGLDPSRPDIHIGHAVVLNKLRQFQDLGHNVILIIGDFTAMIGDPTGKSKTRPALTLEETRENGKTYVAQASTVLDVNKLTVRYNSEWLNTLSFADVISLTAKYTVAQLLERDDFSKRYKSGEPISVHEFMYPLSQAYDSVAIQSDIELGGTDQRFNLLVGREIMRSYGMEPQCILTMPILEGTDGVEKMSKSLDNYIGVTDSPTNMFGKTMSIPDSMIARYLQYATFCTSTEREEVEKGLATGTLHPRTAKVELARRIVARYYGDEAGTEAVAEFERVFVKKDIPQNIELREISELGVCPLVIDLLAHTGLVASKSDARRLMQQGGLQIDGEKITDITTTIDISRQRLIRAGKLKHLYVIAR